MRILRMQNSNMPNSTQYRNPPITEAILDIRVKSRSDLTMDALKAFGEAVVGDFPNQEELVTTTTQFEILGGANATVTRNPEGIKLISAKKDWVVLAQFSGFLVSRLPVYAGWNEFQDKARRLWIEYRNRAEPAEITRLAVRYVNRIDIPEEQVELRDYLRVKPDVPDDLSSMSSFFLQLQVPQPDLQALTLINQTIIPATTVSIALDIDLFRDRDIPQDESKIWEYFEALHDRKNQIFEACITENAKRLFL